MSDDSFGLEGMILSRKISGSSVGRHFVRWKKRMFRLNSSAAMLCILDNVHNKSASQGPPVSISLSSLSVELKEHYYTADKKCCLSLQYPHREELLMKFDCRRDFARWFEAIAMTIQCSKDRAHIHHKSALTRLSGYLLEELRLQQISRACAEGDPGKKMQKHAEAPELLSNEVATVRIIASASSGVEGTAPSSSSTRHGATLRYPPMHIVVMAVGTQGDILPFIHLGLRLKAQGHRVRIATHECFRPLVANKSRLEFYPLAGDPVKLSAFMVKAEGHIIPLRPELLRQMPQHYQMVVDILHSCWPACVAEDPGAGAEQAGPADEGMDEAKQADQRANERPFRANAIISNPVTYGHIHCAEALGVPLHMMFPQPWSPTKAFPHPLSCLSYDQAWCLENALSYQLVDRMMWLSFESCINAFRVTLGLEPLRTGQNAWDILNVLQVPFVKMWSPALVPKPKDWPSHIDIVGTFDEGEVETDFEVFAPPLHPPPTAFDALHPPTREESANTATEQPPARTAPSGERTASSGSFQPSRELERFLASGPIVYVGFGSMVIKDVKKAVGLLLEAAASLGVKLAVQVGWSLLTSEEFRSLALEAQLKATRFQQVSIDKDGMGAEAEAAIHSTQTGLVEDLAAGRIHSADDCLLSDEGYQHISWGATEDVSSTPPLPQTKDHKPPNPPAFAEASAATDAPTDDIDEGWSCIEVLEGWCAERDCYLVPPCPHSWLFPRVSAVVHHGGAGTTAAALRRGLPTWICPFFGDQFFWGKVVFDAGLGPRPCRLDHFSLPLVTASLQALLAPEVARVAQLMGEKLRVEDGVGGAVEAFYRHLPLPSMLCEVSLFRNEWRLATLYCEDCGLRMCQEASSAVHAKPRRSGASPNRSPHRIVTYSRYVDWTFPAPRTAADGLVQGLGGLMYEVTRGLADLLCDPVRGIYNEGLPGAANGVATGLSSLLSKPLSGARLLVRRVQQGLNLQERALFLAASDAVQLEDVPPVLLYEADSRDNNGPNLSEDEEDDGDEGNDFLLCSQLLAQLSSMDRGDAGVNDVDEQLSPLSSSRESSSLTGSMLGPLILPFAIPKGPEGAWSADEDQAWIDTLLVAQEARVLFFLLGASPATRSMSQDDFSKLLLRAELRSGMLGTVEERAMKSPAVAEACPYQPTTDGPITASSHLACEDAGRDEVKADFSPSHDLFYALASHFDNKREKALCFADFALLVREIASNPHIFYA